ncbi:hypothetical protein GGQ80_003323 [Sphingomonas jinjuensis]|uniref:Uncharacterized protein n=1 Tax=Sphingomonas jinjuensis TaxID=535907 RepID=A0A840F837_9SPHN|nr:hypothetical protein [Sphingomonas jinjuensis]MBB4155403.1 hypothetical protein [Sphingomonas jinjuensis]
MTPATRPIKHIARKLDRAAPAAEPWRAPAIPDLVARIEAALHDRRAA